MSKKPYTVTLIYTASYEVRIEAASDAEDAEAQALLMPGSGGLPKADGSWDVYDVTSVWLNDDMVEVLA